jgi:hypothetical protein
VTGGVAPLPALIGGGAKLAVSAKFQGEDITIERAQLDGKTLRVSADGSVKHRIVDLNWKWRCPISRRSRRHSPAD